jgi:hypothetical protein
MRKTKDFFVFLISFNQSMKLNNIIPNMLKNSKGKPTRNATSTEEKQKLFEN